MRLVNRIALLIIAMAMVGLVMPQALFAGAYPRADTYRPSLQEVWAQKDIYDDPRPVKKNFGPAQLCPKEIIEPLMGDVAAMKNAWADVVGFKAPDVTGKIAPEVKPGKYSWQEVHVNPGIQELLLDEHKRTIREPGPPIGCAYAEIEIVPTKQYYFPLRISRVTKENMGKTLQDDQGYIQEETWIAGYPFPRPSGEHKAQQILYNHIYRYIDWGGNVVGYEGGHSWDDKLNVNGNIWLGATFCRFAGRILFEPYGYLCERSDRRKEMMGYQFFYEKPRDTKGMTYQMVLFLSRNKLNQTMFYSPAMRRVRKLSSTDTQDVLAGACSTLDDVAHFNQKMTPDRYPMAYKVIAQREYLVPSPTTDGSEYIDSKTKGIVGAKFERRPVYVVEMTELDTNYVYSKRINVFDQEHFSSLHAEFYDQKGRLYRSLNLNYSWYPEMGMISIGGGAITQQADYVDKQSNMSNMFYIPAVITAEEFSMKGLLKRAR